MNKAHDIDAVREAASQWIARRDAGLTTAEEAEFQEWRGENPAHAAAVARYERLWDRMDGPRTPSAGAQISAAMSTLEGRRRRTRRGIAAVCVLIGLGWGVARWSATPRPEVFDAPSTVAVLTPEHRVLPDGSVVEFPAGTVISVDFSSPEVRRVRIDQGEAHFAVAKNPARPFIVHAGGVDVQAVGTAFAVQLASSAVDVIVTEGRVAVDRREGGGRAEPAAAPGGVIAPKPSANATFVGAGEKVSMAKEGLTGGAAVTAVEAISAAELEQRLAWRNARMEFSNTPLPEVLAAINRYGDAHGGAHFSLAEEALEQVRMSGIFRVDDTRSFVGILETGFSIKTETVAPNRFELRRMK